MQRNNSIIKEGKREIPEQSATSELAQVKPIAHDAHGMAWLTAKRIRQNAENKVANGLSTVLALAKSKAEKNEIPADFQGITTVVLSKQEIINAGVVQAFPFLDNQKNGITVHIFAKDAVQFPPIGYILDQKMSSLLSVFKMMILGKEKKYFKNSHRINIKDIFNNETENKFKAICIEVESEIEKLKKNNVPLNQWNNLVTSSIQSAIAKVLHVLYETCCKLDLFSNKINFEEFAKSIIKESSHHRSNDNHTLTYSEDSQIFSFDEVVSPVTAHDRTIGKNIANLSMVYEGQIKDNKATIASSTFKHASPVAIDDVKTLYVSDMGESDPRLLADTEKNIKQIATAMAQFQVHGGADKSQPVQVDWTYQLLTSNAGDRQKQARTYGYIVKAKNALNGKTFKAEKRDFNVQLNMHVMNAGINAAGGFEFGHKSENQRQENRDAFIHLSKSLAGHLDILWVGIYNKRAEALNKKQNNSAPKPQEPRVKYSRFDLAIRDLVKVYEDGLIPMDKTVDMQKTKDTELKEELKEELKNEYKVKFKEIERTLEAKIISLKDNYPSVEELSFRKQKKLADKITDEMEKAKQKKSELQMEFKHRFDQISAPTKVDNGQMNEAFSQEVENQLKAKWQPRRYKRIENALKTIKQYPEEAKKLDAKVLLSLTALIYKTYIDNLYYSGEYRKPEKAVLFNTYVAAYQRLTGLSGSIGCKSANDRTYVLRLFLAAVEGRDHQATPLPPAYHQDPQALHQLLAQDVSQRVMSNAAIYSCINDTAGGTPKVHDGLFGFPILEPVKGINLLDKFGKFAAEKIKKMISKFNSIIKQSSTLFSKSKSNPKPGKQKPATRMSPTDT